MNKSIIQSRISTREKEVIDFIARGLIIKQIGQRLNISSTMAIIHQKNLRVKLGCKNYPELVYRTGRIGLLYKSSKMRIDSHNW